MKTLGIKNITPGRIAAIAAAIAVVALTIAFATVFFSVAIVENGEAKHSSLPGDVDYDGPPAKTDDKNFAIAPVLPPAGFGTMPAPGTRGEK